MVLGPINAVPAVGEAATKLSPDRMIAEARTVGRILVAELLQAEALSAEWTDQELAYALVRNALDRCLNRLAATGCWGRANQAPSSEFCAVAGEWLGLGSLQPRARNKPRGYAGDFEMFVQFMSGECVDDPAGRLFDLYFQNQAAVEAVRSRTQQIAAAIVERRLDAVGPSPFRVASIGCGPAIDLELALLWSPPDRRGDVRVALLDLDEDAIEHARRRLGALLPAEQIVGRRENLYRLADRPKTLALVEATDVLVCSGLFDYLPDEAATRLLRAFWAQLSDRGTLLVGNFAPHNPSRAYMEWVGNWHLIYRTPDELLALAEEAGIPRTSVSLGAERLGIDLFLYADKGGRRH